MRANLNQAAPVDPSLVPQVDGNRTVVADYILLESLRDEVSKCLRDLLKEEEGFQAQSWRDWADSALAASAGIMHRFSRLMQAWTPTVIHRNDVITAAPQALLQDQFDMYSSLWRPSDEPMDVWVPDRDSFPLATPDQIRVASLSFPVTTSQSVDGFHPRHFSLLSNAALDAIALILQASEMLGAFPQQTMFMVFPLIGKPKGGFRPILLCPGIVRVWQRLRRPLAYDFLRESERPYWGTGPGRSTELIVWRQAAAAEAAVSRGEVAGGFLWDAQKFYENFRLDLLRDRALAAGVPPVLVKISYNLWRSPRLMRMGSTFASEVCYATRGLPAGDIFNDVFVRAYCIQAYDGFTIRHPRVSLCSYVDDEGVMAEGSIRDVTRNLKAAALDLHRVMTDQLHVGLAAEKMATVGSSRKAFLSIRDALGPLAGDAGYSACNLGVDFAPGAARASAWGGEKRISRFAAARQRCKKLHRIRRWLPRGRQRMNKIFLTGAKPAMVYGAAVLGMTDAELRRVRGLMIAPMTP